MAARAWAAGGLDGDKAPGDDEEAVRDARRFGMAEADVAALAAALADQSRGDFSGVWPVNAAVVSAFLAAATQWRTAFALIDGRAVTRFIGLDYAGAAVVWAARNIVPDADLFNRLTVIEEAARDALNAERPA